MRILRILAAEVLCAVAAASTGRAQNSARHATVRTIRSYSDQSTSAISFGKEHGNDVVKIQNTTYDVSDSNVPAFPSHARLVIRKTVQSKQVMDEVGVQATTTVEAWPLHGGLSRKPLYSISIAGTDAQIVDSALVEVSRGLEEVDWWSVFQLGTGRHLFDTYVPLVRFSLSRATLKLRYVGLEVPSDDPLDRRLGAPNVVAVLTYASAEGVIREALLTTDNSDQARYLRSYADETRAVTIAEVASSLKPDVPSENPALSVNISWSRIFPSPPSTLTAVVPLAGDDLDLDHAQLPPGLHIAAWKR